MKIKKIVFLLLMGIVFNVFSQQEKIIYLDFNKSIDSIRVNTEIYGDTLISKSFRFYKNIPKEKYKYHLDFYKGKIVKSVEADLTHFKPGKVSLSYYSDIQKSYNCKELNIDKKNSITYKDFLETNFTSFFDLLTKADKIFFIVKKEKKVYEVKISLY